MATLVLSTVGMALGGPLGGALGSLVGQSIDQSLFGPGMRRGPRLGDLSVQTSSYGSPVPRIYGTMRVAGTVIWSTDIQEKESIEGGGKGSPEYVAYGYSASFAVALSSRPVREVRRIWADGKLIRGRGGDFKVKTKFRLCSGSEDQPADKLIASIEGVGETPAYRGLAIAIFEDLDLGEFGNRIPVLTFEAVADDVITLGDLLRDASGGLIEAIDDRPIPGYAAHGGSIGDSLAGLIDLFGVQLAERGGALRSPVSGPAALIGDDELGADADGRRAARVERGRAPDSAMPSSLAMTYYDPDRDYQTGQMRASSGTGGSRSERIELPAVLTGDRAKAVVEEALARKWRGGDRVRLRLGPSRLGLRPGDPIQLCGNGAAWAVRSATVEGLVVSIEAEAAPVSVQPIQSDSGRIVTEPDVQIGRTEMALFELPPDGSRPGEYPVVYLAASCEGGWKPVPVELKLGQELQPAIGVLRRSALGFAETAIQPRSPMVLDEYSSVIVRMVEGSAALLNADEDALMAGANLAMLGNELIQFGRADEVSVGRYRLSKLLRGRRGTEWAAVGHEAGEAFCLVDSSLRTVELQSGTSNSQIVVTAHGIGDVAPLPSAVRNISAESMRPPSPCKLEAAFGAGMLSLRWVRRSHFGWVWTDEVGVSVDGFAEAYRVTIDGPQGSVTIETSQPLAEVPVAELPADVGQEVRVGVVTVGPKALSRRLFATLTL